jgi:hypothetical protein
MIAMFLSATINRKTRAVRIVSYGLVFAVIFFFSLHSELDSSIAKVSPSSIAKVKKDFRSYQGKGQVAALTPAFVDWTPTFHPSFLIIADEQNFLDGHRLGSRQTRAPPSRYSL